MSEIFLKLRIKEDEKELQGVIDYNKSSNVYQNLINSGELKLLSNTTIKTMLHDLEEAYIYLNGIDPSTVYP